MIIVLLYSLLPGLLLQGLDNLKTFLEAVRKCTVGCTASRLVVCAYVCVCVCIRALLHKKSDAEYRLAVGPSCFSMLQEAQSGRTRGSLAVLAP